MVSLRIALIVVAIASAGLGLVVYRRAPTRRSNRLWSVVSLLEVCWLVTTYLIVTAQDPHYAVAYIRLVHLISALLLVTLVDFCWAFPERVSDDSRPRSRWLLYLSGLLVGAIATLPHLVVSIEMGPGAPDVRFGWPLLPLTIYTICLFLHADLTLWRKARELRGMPRLQTLYVLVGAIIAQVVVFNTNLLLPVITGHSTYAPWGSISYFFIIAATAVSMAKHNLWDVGTAGRRLAAAILAVGSILTVAFIAYSVLTLWWPELQASPMRWLLLWLLTGVVLGMSAAPVYSWYRGLISRSLDRDRQRVSRLLNELEAAIVQRPTDTFGLERTIEASEQFVRAAFAAAYVADGDGRFATVAIVDRHSYLPDDWPGTENGALPHNIQNSLRPETLRNPVNIGRLLRFANTEHEMAQLRAMEQLDAAVAVPLLWRRELVGLILVGPKLSGDVYTAEEIDLMRTVGAHGAIAVKNSELTAQIVAEKERTEKIISQMGSGVIAIGSDERISVINPAASRLLETDPQQVLGKHAGILPGPLRDGLLNALRTGYADGSETTYLPGDKPLHIAVSPFVIVGHSQSPEGAGVVFRDLSTEDALRRAEQEAERLRFIRTIAAGLAHEIRNPLVSVQTFAQLAPSRLEDPEFRESFLEVARSEIAQLEELVSQFMTLARPTREVREAVSLDEVIEQAVLATRQQAHAKRITVTTELPEHAPPVIGDPARLRGAATNLIINAIDATPEDGAIEVRLVPAAAGQTLNMEVWNSGSYIPPSDRERLFEPFYTTKTSGTGLGLAICETIAQEHDGRILVHSDKEQGTTFTIALPVEGTSHKQKVTSK